MSAMPLSLLDLSHLMTIEPAIDFLNVLDLRTEPVSLLRLFRRPCYANGVWLQQLSHQSEDEIILQLEGALAILYTDPKTLPGWQQRLQVYQSGSRHWIQVQGTSYIVSGQALSAGDPQQSTCSTQLQLQGQQEIRIPETNLPVQFKVQIPESKSLRTLQIKGYNPFFSLPAPQWFRLPHSLPAGITQLELDIQPASDGQEHWQLRHTATGFSIPALTQAPLGHKLLKEQGRLALILDRTCPDADAWSAARQVLLTPQIPQSVLPPSFHAQEDPFQIGDLNRQIRQTLAEGLQAFFQNHLPQVQIELAWFADSPQPHLAHPGHLTLPHKAANLLLPQALPNLRQSMEQITYAPGLDIWDPLELALSELVDSFERHQTWAPVLIVGNSPPNPPELNPQSPFFQLLQKTHTTFRRPWQMGSGRSFPELLNKLEKQGVPVVYLFLYGHRPLLKDERENRFYQAFEDHQREVESLLRQYLKVVPCAFSSFAGTLQQVLYELLQPVVSAVKILPEQVRV